MSAGTHQLLAVAPSELVQDAHAQTDVPSDSDTMRFKLGDFAIDEYRPVKVVVIGAGFSGILAAIRLPQRIPNIEVTVYEKNTGVGGTWYSNRYPGLACDIPSHSYQYTFETNKNWSAFYAPGPSIRAYLEGVVAKYDLLPRLIKLQHEVVRAEWDEMKLKWMLDVRRPNESGGAEYEAFSDEADVLITCVGALSRWNWPDIEGLRSFGGTLMHSANWNLHAEGDDWENGVNNAGWSEKRVGVIGVGSSAIQIVPALQPRVKHLYNFVRGRTWLSPSFAAAKMEELLGRSSKPTTVHPPGNSHSDGKAISRATTPETLRHSVRDRVRSWIFPSLADNGSSRSHDASEVALNVQNPSVAQTNLLNENYEFTAKDIKRFQDPQFYKEFRQKLEDDLNAVHSVTLVDSAMQRGAVEAFEKDMRRKLDGKPSIAASLIPDFPVGCRRLTPGPGFLNALCQDNVDFVSTNIKRVLKKGVELQNGETIDLDVLICATGYDTSFQLPFPIVVPSPNSADKSLSLNDTFTPYPCAYLSIVPQRFPNLFLINGPNSSIGSGSLLVMFEREVEYVCKVVAKMQRERIGRVEVKPEAFKDWEEYVESYFPKTVYGQSCRSWYKMGEENGRVTALWPGSCLHSLRTFEHPRWEDFNYEPFDRKQNPRKNRFFWLGEGQTLSEKEAKGDRAWYLNENQVDHPPVPEVQVREPNVSHNRAQPVKQ